MTHGPHLTARIDHQMSIPQNEHARFAEALKAGDASTVHSAIERYPDLVCHPEWVPPPLHCAILWNQPEMASILLDNGADIESTDPDRKTTPLRYAIMYARTDTIPMLLARGANTGPIVDGGTTALQLATEAANGQYEAFDDLPARDEYDAVVQLLRQAGLTQ